MLIQFTVWFLAISGVLSQSNLPNYTHVKIGVVIDEAWVSSDGSSADELTEIFQNTFSATNFAHGEFELDVITEVPLEKEYGQDMTAVISLTDCKKSHALSRKVAKQHFTLHVALSDIGCKRLEYDTSFLIPVVEPVDNIVQLLSDLRYANTLQWQSFILITDDSISNPLQDHIYQRLARDATISTFSLAGNDKSSIKRLLDGFPGHDLGAKFLVMTRKALIEDFMDVVAELNMFHVSFQWVYVVTDSNEQDTNMNRYIEKAEDGYNLAFVFNTSSTTCESGLLCLVNEMATVIAAAYDDTLGKEMKSFVEYRLEEWDVIKPTKKMRQTSVVMDMKKYLKSSRNCYSCVKWTLQSVEVQGHNSIEPLYVGSWTTQVGLDLADDLLPHTTGGFRRRVITVGSIEYAPWMYKEDGRWTGLIFELLDQISWKLNFTYEVEEPRDGKWGVKDSSGNWNGLIRQVVDGDVMLAAAAFTVSRERLEAVNFSMSLDVQPYTFMYRRPKETSRALLFLDPFTGLVWLCIGLMTIIIGPVLWIINRASRLYEYYELVNEFGLFKLESCMFYCYGALMQQGGPVLPDPDSSRMVVGFWWLFVTVLMTTYTGSLVAFLTIPSIELPINTLADLMKMRDSDGIRWGLLDGSVIQSYLQNSDVEKFQILNEQAVLHTEPDIAPTGEVYEMIKEDDHVYIDWKSHLEVLSAKQYAVSRECDYAFGKEEFFNEQVAMAFPKDSPWIKDFDRITKMALQTGLLKAWKQKFWPKEDECYAERIAGFGTALVLTITDMQGSFGMCMFGLLIGVLVLIGELMVWHANYEAAWKQKGRIRPIVSHPL